MTTLEYAGRHRKPSAYNPGVHRIVASGVTPAILIDGTLYVSLCDRATDNALGIDFGRDAIAALRYALGSGAPTTFDGFSVRKYGAGLSACICGPSRSVQCVVHGATS